MNPITSWIQRIANRFGLYIVRIPASALDYCPVSPVATYNPWRMDRQFQQVFNSLRPYSLVDEYRCFELWKLVEQVSKLDRGSLIEVGVWRGGTGALIATQAARCGIAEAVYLCDTFAGVVKAGPEDRLYKGGEHADTSRQAVEDVLFGRLGLHNVKILQGIFPEETGEMLQDTLFRFCHIDVDVYQSARDIVEWIWDKMVPGGIIVFDDYGFCGCEGIAKCVEEQMSRRDSVVIHNLNGHAIMLKLLI